MCGERKRAGHYLASAFKIALACGDESASNQAVVAFIADSLPQRVSMRSTRVRSFSEIANGSATRCAHDFTFLVPRACNRINAGGNPRGGRAGQEAASEIRARLQSLAQLLTSASGTKR